MPLIARTPSRAASLANRPRWRTAAHLVLFAALVSCASPDRDSRGPTSEPATTSGEWAFASAAEDAVHDGRLGDAEHLLRQRIASHPADAEANGLLAVVVHRLGHLDEALNFARTAHALAPADPLFAANLVLVALDAGEQDLARATLDRARTLPTFPADLLVALDERLASMSEVVP